ncbi:MAG: MgtC/SapB family protein [Saprospiraceae bacterium]|nr:MgtC/SapB family protein [Saprospiraceae bacterium]
MNLSELFQALFPPFFSGLLVATGVGLIIGLEREFDTHEEPGHIGGIRTFILVSLAGYAAGFLALNTDPGIWVAALGGFMVLTAIAYFLQAQKGKSGLTTPLALVLTFMLGLLIANGYVREPLAVVVVITTVLSLKTQLHGFIRQVTREEWLDFVKFIVLALLVLPMLPDHSFGPEQMMNFRDLGWIAVLVLSISFTGYLLLKFTSANIGVLSTAIIGGLFSSTLIAWVFSAKSRDRPDLGGALGAGIVLASSIMFVRVWVWTFLFAHAVAVRMTAPLLIMLVLSLLPTWLVLRNRRPAGDTPQVTPGNPLDIKNAILFVLLYIGVTYFMYFSREWLGTAMTYLSGAVSGIADIDAITITTSKWAATTPDVNDQAATIILLAVLSNSVFKLVVSLLNGDAALRRPVLIGFGPVLIAGAAFVVYWLAG